LLGPATEDGQHYHVGAEDSPYESPIDELEDVLDDCVPVLEDELEFAMDSSS
jgi:hypothetical protein